MNELMMFKNSISNLKNIIESENGKFIAQVDYVRNILSITELNEYYKCFITLMEKETPCVYFMRNKYTNFIKIGQTHDVLHRLKSINTILKNNCGMEDAIELLGVICVFSGCSLKLESLLHEKYRQYREFGEWFSLPDSLIEEIRRDNDFIIKNVFVNITPNSHIENDGYPEIKISDLYLSADLVNRYCTEKYISEIPFDIRHIIMDGLNYHMNFIDVLKLQSKSREINLLNFLYWIIKNASMLPDSNYCICYSKAIDYFELNKF